ncbi:MAG: YkgJ family cysteine cluster protein [Candidatus Omnitrophota bacterium]
MDLRKILIRLSGEDQFTVNKLLELYKEVDEKAANFISHVNISCPEGCGICCKGSAIETTVLEMLPAALYFWSVNEAENQLALLEAAKEPGQCVFFKPDSGTYADGRCGIYKLRPLICRLFGFFTIKNKYGKYVYGSCKIIKEKSPEAYQRAQETLTNEHHPSEMTNFSIQILSMGLDIGRKMLPINTAASIAIEKIGFTLRYNKNDLEPFNNKAA